ncbi:hypothetical protein I6Y99_005220 [Vibrio parahaemolyticus]|nr:hypothetical protein [Vibrio parahaemolyticus]EGQ7811142.1 hypothetical protein [Vibrio parahaemolyticus]ELA6925478.1 hypothetical protein [Vibrio parahaemolyticus]MDF5667784.1 hypothetical protein [Vibrio parahaemolyticus]HBC3530911.1 hypothetical protein [Vibrio parahaemolyticus]
MKDDELAKLLCIAIILFAGFGIASLSSLLDVPFGVMMDSILLELIPVIIAGICIALKIKEGVSLQWGVPVFVATIYLGLIPLMNYKAVPFHSDALRFEPEFYGQSWFHFMVFALIVVSGYGLLWYKHKHSW